MITDSLQLLYNINKPDISIISKICFGERQLAVMLINSNLGTCTTLGNHLFAKKKDLLQPDFSNISHRALLIAYYSAFYNYSIVGENQGDILDVVNFNLYQNIVMIGYFRTLAEKIDSMQIPLIIFDLASNEERLTKINKQDEHLGKADAIILTATTLYNNTFDKIMSKVNSDSDVFLLGPTSVLCQDLFYHKNVKYIFGAVFNETEKVLKTIEEGGGIKDIRSLMKKIYLKRPENWT